MTIMTVYVKAKSKRDINRRLEDGYIVTCVEHKMGEKTLWPMESLPEGTVVKVWSMVDPDGVPIAKAYGNWDAKKGRVR